jgi:hypothetical protein
MELFQKDIPTAKRREGSGHSFFGFLEKGRGIFRFGDLEFGQEFNVLLVIFVEGEGLADLRGDVGDGNVEVDVGVEEARVEGKGEREGVGVYEAAGTNADGGDREEFTKESELFGGDADFGEADCEVFLFVEGNSGPYGKVGDWCRRCTGGHVES